MVKDVMHEGEVEDAVELGIGVAAGELAHGEAHVLAPGVLGIGAMAGTDSAQQVLMALDEGRVVDQGPHDELFARHAGYRELVEAYARERADGADDGVAAAPVTIEAVTDRG